MDNLIYKQHRPNVVGHDKPEGDSTTYTTGFLTSVQRLRSSSENSYNQATEQRHHKNC